MAVPPACPPADEFDRLLTRHASADQREHLLGHLEHCPRCWETVSPLLAGDTLLDGVSLGTSGVAPDLFKDLLAINATPAEIDGLPTAGATIGHYRILRLLGRGGMGAVCLATDVRLDRSVALKVMLPRHAANKAARERFLREAHAAAQITHDNVVTVHEADDCDGTPYIAMQWLLGCSLDEALRQRRSFAVPEILRIGAEAAAGLAAAHARGLVHRDVKPANLWLEAPGDRVKVLDFGLAKPQDTDVELTRDGDLLGTPAYMSPEQARGRTVDSRTDLFSLGVVLYRLATGTLPFDGPDTIAVLMALGSDEPKPVRELNAEVHPALAALIHDLLRKNPADRPATAADVVRRLQAIAANPTMPDQPRRPAVAAKWIAAGFAALLAAAAGVVIVIKNKDGTETKITAPDGATVTVNDDAGKPLAAVTDAEDAAWEQSVARLKPEQQTVAVSARLKQLNPKFDDKSTFYTIDKGTVTAMEVRNASELAELKPIRALPNLKLLYFDGGFRNPCDITPLRGMQLTDLHFNGCPVKDVSPLAGMPLRHCYFWGNMTRDLTPLAGMKLVRTNVGHSMQKDLEVFRGMPLEFICMNHSQVEDLSPLKDAPLTRLELANTKVTDLSPIANKPIELIYLYNTPVKDYSPLKTLPLKVIEIDNPKAHAEILRAIPTLTTINGKPAVEVLGKP